MKKAALFILSALVCSITFGQSDNYSRVMSMKISELDTITSAEQFQDIANSFERIGAAEKGEWLPYYYSALSLIKKGQASRANQDELGEKAEQLVDKAAALSAGNAELFILKKMIANLRMSVDPMSRYMLYGPIAVAAVNAAKNIEPDNPRVALLEAEDLYYTPEQFGGSKMKAKALFDKAVLLFSGAKPPTPIHPKWGMKEARYYLSKYNDQ